MFIWIVFDLQMDKFCCVLFWFYACCWFALGAVVSIRYWVDLLWWLHRVLLMALWWSHFSVNECMDSFFSLAVAALLKLMFYYLNLGAFCVSLCFWLLKYSVLLFCFICLCCSVYLDRAVILVNVLYSIRFSVLWSFVNSWSLLCIFFFIIYVIFC